MHDTNNKAKILLVVGMHRSGTSALTRVLNLLGAELPQKLIDALQDNPTGFWEPLEIVNLQDAALASLGSSWDDPCSIPISWFESLQAKEYQEKIAAFLTANHTDNPFQIIKDPRTSRLIPLWVESLRKLQVEPYFIICYRHPDEVAASLRKRNGLSRIKSYMLWLRYTLESERNTRGYKRCFCGYSDLMADWRESVKKISQELNIIWPRQTAMTELQIDQFLMPELHHHIAEREHTVSIDNPQWFTTVYSWLQNTSHGNPQPAEQLDQIWQELSTFDLIHAPLHAEIKLNTQELLKTEKLNLEVKQTELAQRQTEFAQTQTELTQTQTELIQTQTELAQRQTVLAQTQTELAQTQTELAQTQTELTVMRDSRSWRLTRPLRVAGNRLRQGRNLARKVLRYKRVHGLPALVRKLYATVFERGIIARMLAAQSRYQGMQSFASDQGSILMVSHDARLGGAPINLLRLARFLRQHYGFALHFLIYQGGPKLDEFHELGAVHLLDISYRYEDSLPGHVEQTVATLARNGVKRVIANTVISGSLTKLLKQHGMTVISLIHEMPQLMEQMNLLTNAEQLATYSDAVIFGGSAVRNAFPFPETLPTENTFMLGQGVYHYSTPYSRKETRVRLRTQLGIAHNARIVFGCGQTEPRKGVDLFAHVLMHLADDIQDVFFVWLGIIAKSAYVAELQQALQHKQLTTRFILLDKFENDPSLYFCGSDIFFLSSREDPFPSVVLEAMRTGLPAATFAGTGGAEEMLGEGRGIVARHLDVEDMAEKLRHFLQHPDPALVQRAYAYARDFTYERYASRILAIFRAVEYPDKGFHHNAAIPYRIQAPVPVADAKRILHIIGNFHMGGSSKLIADIIEGVGSEFRHHIITQSNPSPHAYLGVSVEELPLDTPDCVFRDRFDAYLPDCIHVHYWGSDDMPWYSRVFANLTHMTVPVIQNVNTPVDPYESPVVTRNVFVSQYTEKTFGKNDKKNLVIYPGVDFEHYFRHADVSLRDPNCVGMVYRLDGDKITLASFDPLIALAKMRPSITILVVGGGALFQQVQAKIADAGVANQFQLMGHVAFEDLPRYYSRMSVFLAPVIAESFGQVTPIAMVLQLPVVAYDVGALGEILDTPSSLVPVGDSTKFAEKVYGLLDNSTQREELGKWYKERAIHLFSLQTMISAYQQLYNESIST